jgi:hypothetical protein
MQEPAGLTSYRCRRPTIERRQSNFSTVSRDRRWQAYENGFANHQHTSSRKVACSVALDSRLLTLQYALAYAIGYPSTLSLASVLKSPNRPE